VNVVMGRQWWEIHGQIIAAERMELFASSERVEWILARYQEEKERGRPGLLHLDRPHRSKKSPLLPDVKPKKRPRPIFFDDDDPAVRIPDVEELPEAEEFEAAA